MAAKRRGEARGQLFSRVWKETLCRGGRQKILDPLFCISPLESVGKVCTGVAGTGCTAASISRNGGASRTLNDQTGVVGRHDPVCSVSVSRVADDEVSGDIHLYAAIIADNLVSCNAAAFTHGVDTRSVATPAAISSAAVSFHQSIFLYQDPIALVSGNGAVPDCSSLIQADSNPLLVGARRVGIVVVADRATDNGRVGGNLDSATFERGSALVVVGVAIEQGRTLSCADSRIAIVARATALQGRSRPYIDSDPSVPMGGTANERRAFSNFDSHLPVSDGGTARKA